MSSLDDILLSSGLYEEMYRKWEADPASIDPAWGKAFQDFERRPAALSKRSVPLLRPPEEPQDQALLSQEVLKERVARLIDAWRQWGHFAADFNPLEPPVGDSRLDVEAFGFSSEDMSLICPTLGILPEAEASLGELVDRLKEIYGNRIGVEYKGLTGPEIEAWLEGKLEKGGFPPEVALEEKQMILEELSKSELLETFMHTKYVGQKRFSLEGSETLIPMVREAIDAGSAIGVEEFVIGMSHRGRLNVLSNIINKSYKEIFSEFDEGYIPDAFEGTGDVKYHKGFETAFQTKRGASVKVVLTPNPSHLESVDPVVQGQVKGRQIKSSEEKVMALQIHGEAAIAAQGVVYETLQLQRLKGYATGGTIHFVINNQIGFTTHPQEGRCTRYCTDIAKAFGCPVFHVNAEDPEGCVAVVKLAVQFRQKFRRDIFIDLYCWRKYGHNEGDEPTFTQPHLYRKIKEKRGIREQYRDLLIHGGKLEHALAEAMEQEFKKALSEAKESIKIGGPKAEEISRARASYRPLDVATAVPKNELVELASKLSEVPEGFHIHPKVEALAKGRVFDGDKPIDWGMGEILAYATLLASGRTIRLSGQDVERGTFSHRHAVWVDQQSDEKYSPLAHLSEKQGRFFIYNSPLSEFGVLGFEYGYSLSVPEGLTIWEAQFGDFANGGQVVMDQYIASSEQKWGQKSNLTLFLPHGYEGQGPEHSSGRIERFLSLAADDNLRICNPSLPHQHFHLLRRQVLSSRLKPLIVFTPKAYLRHPNATSRLEDLTEGQFQEILDDPDPPKNPKKLALCSGKIYFELKAHADKIKDESVAFVRIEQLYPLYTDRLKAIFEKYREVREILWVQEEPKNMGAWRYLRPLLEEVAKRKVHYVGRPESASPAAGIYVYHKKEVHEILEGVFAKDQPTTYEIAGQFRA